MNTEDRVRSPRHRRQRGRILTRMACALLFVSAWVLWGSSSVVAQQVTSTPTLRICTGCVAAGNFGRQIQQLLQHAQQLQGDGRLRIEHVGSAGGSRTNPSQLLGPSGNLLASGFAENPDGISPTLTALRAAVDQAAAPPPTPQTRGRLVFDQQGPGLASQPGSFYYDTILDLLQERTDLGKSTRNIFQPTGQDDPPLSQRDAQILAEQVTLGVRNGFPERLSQFAVWLVRVGPLLTHPVLSPDELARIDNDPGRISFTPLDTRGVRIGPGLYFFDQPVPIGDGPIPRSSDQTPAPRVAVALEQEDRIEIRRAPAGPPPSPATRPLSPGTTTPGAPPAQPPYPNPTQNPLQNPAPLNQSPLAQQALQQALLQQQLARQQAESQRQAQQQQAAAQRQAENAQQNFALQDLLRNLFGGGRGGGDQGSRNRESARSPAPRSRAEEPPFAALPSAPSVVPSAPPPTGTTSVPSISLTPEEIEQLRRLQSGPTVDRGALQNVLAGIFTRNQSLFSSIIHQIVSLIIETIGRVGTSGFAPGATTVPVTPTPIIGTPSPGP